MTSNTNNIVRIELAGYKQPNSVSVYNSSTGVHYWGADNLYPQYLISLIKRSVKHAAIINGKVKYVVGSGVESVGPIDVENDISTIDNFAELMRKIAYDYEVFNGFAVEVIKNKTGGFGSINHIRFANLRKDKEGKILYKKDWTNRKETAQRLEKYNNVTKEGVFIYDEYSIVDSEYPTPYYEGAISYIETDASIAMFRVNNIKNGFSAGTIVNFANGIPTEEEQKQVDKNFKKKFTGEDTAGEVVLTFSNGADKAPTVISVTPNNFDKLFTDLDNACTDNLFIGHSVTSPMLMGVKTEGQLGGRTEIVEAHELFQIQYVDARQQAIQDVFNYLLNPYSTKIDIKPFNSIQEKLSEGALMTILTKNELRKMAGFEDIVETPVQMHSHDDKVLTALLKSGSNDYEIIKEGFSCSDSQQAEYFENVLKAQQFSTIPENDLKVLQYLKENPKSSEREISNALKLDIDKVRESVNALIEGKLISGAKGIEVQVTSKGDNELISVEPLEIETRYKYAVRNGVPAAKQSREFCVSLEAQSNAGKTWSREEIDKITNEFGENAWTYRGGWYHNPSVNKTVPYCRHEWKQVIVRKK